VEEAELRAPTVSGGEKSCPEILRVPLGCMSNEFVVELLDLVQYAVFQGALSEAHDG
jgi:hypothetical protein